LVGFSSNQGSQSENASFTTVVCAEDEDKVFHAYDHDQRPEHQRKNAGDVRMGWGNSVFTVKAFSNRVNRTRADIPEYDTKGGQ